MLQRRVGVAKDNEDHNDGKDDNDDVGKGATRTRRMLAAKQHKRDIYK